MRMNYLNIRPLLEDVEWDFHGGPAAPYGDWAVETREEFAYVAAARLPIVREACESGKYNAIVLLGGGEPGFVESREIARQYGIPVTSCAFSQMHIASMLGNKFSVIDFTETHNMFYYDLVVRHRFTDRCASIRNINFYHARPGHEDETTIADEREKALRGEPSEAVERAVRGSRCSDRGGWRRGHHLRMLRRFLAPVLSSEAPVNWAGRSPSWRGTVAPLRWPRCSSTWGSMRAVSTSRATAPNSGGGRRYSDTAVELNENHWRLD